MIFKNCQQPMKKNAKKQRNQGDLIEASKAFDKNSLTSHGQTSDNAELHKVDYHALYGIPKRISGTIQSLNNKVNIAVDAEIRVPNQPLPIVRVIPIGFSQEQVYDLRNRLAGDKKMIARSNNKETISETERSTTKQISSSLYFCKGESTTKFQLDWKGVYMTYYLHATDPIPETAKPYVTKTPAQMKECVDSILEKIGLTGRFAINDIVLYPYIDDQTEDLLGYMYHVYCSRFIDGVPVCKSTDVNMGLYAMEKQIASEWLYETFEIGFDSEGNEGIFWESPVEIQEVLKTNCHLQPFSFIRTVMESQLPMLLSQQASGEHVKKCTANIYRVDLGLWRIREKSNNATGVLVPAYCFYMEILYEYDNEREKWNDTLIINAVDGSIIDPWKEH